MLVFLFLALISASVADNDRNKATSSVPIYTSDWLKKILADREQNPVLGNSETDVDIDSFLISINLNEAAEISKEIKLKQILSQNEGPFTMIIPSDQAIKKFKQDYPEVYANKSALTNIMKAGIVAGTELLYNAISDEKVVRSISGAKLRFNIYQQSGTQVKTTNGAQVVEFDHKTENIVVHVVDRVMPIPDGDIVKILSRVPQFSILVELVNKAGMVDILKGIQPLTVLAPTNRAFKSLPKSLLDDLKHNTQKWLKYHIIEGSKFSAGLWSGQRIVSLQGAIDVKKNQNGAIRLIDSTPQRASVIVRDVPADNGVIHVINKVLVPPPTPTD